MPFQSEKQRRYLWLKHPDIAHRWAHEYPNQKKLPMYADNKENKHNDDQISDDSKVKQAVLAVLRNSLLKQSSVSPQSLITKKSNSILEYVQVPHSNKPVAAGDEHVTLKKEQQKKVNPEHLFGFKSRDEDVTGNNTIGEKLGQLLLNHKAFADVLQKSAAIIRLGKKHKKNHKIPAAPANFAEQQDGQGGQGIKDLNSSPIDAAPQEFNNVGLDYPKMLQQIAQIKQQRAWALQQAMMFPPAGSDKKQQQSAPVAAYPGMNSAPQSVAANKPAMQSGASNPIGLKGPLNTQNGIPTFAQNLTGNAAFGRNTA